MPELGMKMRGEMGDGGCLAKRCRRVYNEVGGGVGVVVVVVVGVVVVVVVELWL